jgi:hypothetical protein
MGYDVDALRRARARPVSGLGSAGASASHRASALVTTNLMSGPVASNLVLLSDLEQCVPGMKVRFLGWYCRC